MTSQETGEAAAEALAAREDRPPRGRSSLGRLALLAGAGALAGGFVLGIVESVRSEGRLPAASLEYLPSIDRLLAEDRNEEALRQMRLAIDLAFDDASVAPLVLPGMADLAARLDNRTQEVFALRRLAAASPRDAGLHLRLSSALLDLAELTQGQLREAGDHAEMALQLEPRSAIAFFNLGRVALAIGGGEQAPALLRRATALDPSLEDECRQARAPVVRR